MGMLRALQVAAKSRVCSRAHVDLKHLVFHTSVIFFHRLSRESTTKEALHIFYHNSRVGVIS